MTDPQTALSKAPKKTLAVEPAKPTETAKPKADWSGEIPVLGMWLPRAMASNGNMSLVVGNHFASGLSCSGVVQSITILPNRIVRVIVENANNGKRGAILFTGDGTYLEVDTKQVDV
jgi:hypothetical protein